MKSLFDFKRTTKERKESAKEIKNLLDFKDSQKNNQEKNEEDDS